MKKRPNHFFASFLVLALLLALMPAQFSASAATSELFFSEYIEGSSFNKAVEIYNGTGVAVDLSTYSMELYSNGAASPSQSVALSGTLADGDVFVIAHASADPAILAVADATSSAVINFNGDDAIVLRNNGVVVDAFGQVGFDPGSEWVGGGLDDTLRRSENVCAGDTNSNDAFDASIEWITFPINAFDGLGVHTANCNGPTVTDPKINEFVFNHTGTDTNEYVEVFGDANTDYSAFAILQIEGDGTGAGVIDTVHIVGTTDTGGYWFTGFLNNAFENGTVTLLLVKDFVGAAGNDLDTDNDGVLDSTPWTSIVDDVAVSDGGAGDFAYSGTVLAPGFGGPFTPGGASRIPDGTDTDSVDDWMVNDFDLAGIPGFTGTPDVGEAYNTPGAVNEAVMSAPQLVINEIDYDQPSTDTAEFIEIKNNGDAAVDLSGWTLELVNGTGGGATIYNTINLPAVSLPSGDYFVVCANAATVTSCDLDASPNTDFIQNGAPDAVGLRFNGVLMDAVSYEGNTGTPYTEGSGVGLEDAGADGGISRCPDGTDTNQNNVDFVFTGTITPGVENSCGGGGPEPQEVKIHEVQGSGSASPLVDALVAIEGIVVSDFQDGASGTNGDLNGFHVQEEDADADADALTSEGIFVFDGSSPAVDVQIGDLVRVEGVVSEFNGLTEITSFSGVSVLSSANPLPVASILSLPVTSVDDFERYEGMLVTFPQALVISEYFNFDRYGEIVLTSERHLTPTAEFEPGVPSIQAAQEFLLDRITLDDGRTNQNPDPAIHPNGNIFDLTNLFRGGDTVANVTGVMDYSFGLYRIQPTQGADYTNANPRPAQPDDVGGNIKVASFNVLNYFTTLDYPTGDPLDNKCGPLQNQECRGADADQPFEFTRQRDKIIAALTTIDADVVGLIEIENHPDDVPTADLVSGLNDIMGVGTYDYIATGAIGTDAIRVAFIYKPASVSPLGNYAILDESVDPRFLDDFNRPALAQTFQDTTTGGIFTVTVNHLKSKGSACDAIGDPDLGDGQGNCNLTRKAAAEALVDWLATDPTGSGDEDFLIIGDLNSYDKEDPIDAILAGGYTDLIYQFLGEDAYSYVFDGQIGYLDHALANAGLMDEVTGVTVWHINADEADLIDYDTSFKQDAQDAIYAPDAYRSSDHDPVIVGLQLNPSFPTTPVLDDFNRSNGSLGSNWRGSKSAYRITNNQVDVRRDGPIYWKDAFGINQEVFITLTNVDPNGWEQDLLLKVQDVYGPNWGDGVIEVLYSAKWNNVTVWTFRPDTLMWFMYPPISATFSDGDQFGAQALTTGDVVVLKNGFEIGRVTLNAADQNFFNPRGGNIGLWFIGANNAFFDDFGGGDITQR